MRYPMFTRGTTERNSKTIFSNMELGLKVDRRFLSEIPSVRGYEQTYDNDLYFCSVVVYPKGERILSFDKIFKQVVGIYGEGVLPVYVLVNNGVFGNWFALFFRKALLPARWP